jgi:thiol:disulfide interchange protein
MSDNPGTKVRNILLALVAIALSVAIFIGNSSSNNSSSLEAQAQQAVDLDIALTDGKPSLVEFYADWCTSCQTMATDLATLKQEYAQSVDFVMLNVDNPKWLPEVLRYRVDGIPHFIFLDEQGEAIAQTIGEQPLKVMEQNLNALVANLPIPHSYSLGQTSQFTPSVNAKKAISEDPRSHGV